MKRTAFAVLVPILVLSGWTLSLGFNRMSGLQLRVRVEGYDPRDLLAGHFTTFALSVDSTLACGGSAEEGRCLCFGREVGTVFNVPYWGGACEDRPVSCRAFLRGTCPFGRFVTGRERYSIPERLSPVLLRAPPDASVLLSVDEDGGSLVQGMMVGDESLEAYGERKLAEASADSVIK